MVINTNSYSVLHLRIGKIGVSIFLISMIMPAFATSPTQIAPDTGVQTTDYQFALVGNSPTTYIKFDSNFYADGIAIGSQQINFTNIAIGASGSTQSFGLNVQSANLTITGIASDNIGMKLTGSATTYFYYALTGFTPAEVDVIPSSGNTAIIKSASMYTTLSDYNAASSPAIFQNTTGQYLQIKSTDTGSTSIIVYQTSAPITSGGGGGGGGVIPTPQQSGAANPQATAVVQPFTVLPGQSKTNNIHFTFTGATTAFLNSITFSSNRELFTLGQALPVAASITTNPNQIDYDLPLTVTLPTTFNTYPTTVSAIVSVTIGSTVATMALPISITNQTSTTLPTASITLNGPPFYDTTENVLLGVSVVALLIVVVKVATGKRRMRIRL